MSSVSTDQASSVQDQDPIRVLVADDHIVVQEGIAAIVARQLDMTVVATASDGSEAVELWRLHRPDVALIDLRMPKLDGFRIPGD